MNLTTNELEKLKACQSEQEWDEACDAIQAARDGHYPPDWRAKVWVSGLMERVASRWGSDFEIKMRLF